MNQILTDACLRLMEDAVSEQFISGACLLVLKSGEKSSPVKPDTATSRESFPWNAILSFDFILCPSRLPAPLL